MGATPRPWKAGIADECHDIFDANGAKVCRVYHNLTDRFDIVRAMNAHDALVEALQELLRAEWMVSRDWGGDRPAVIAKAEAALRLAEAR